MEKVEARPILVTLDGDGVLFRGGLPVKTAVNILRGNLDIPHVVERGKPFKKHSSIVAPVWTAYMNLYNRLVPFNKQALHSLGLIKHMGIFYRGAGQVKLGILSGRETAYHRSTLARLKNPKVSKFIDPEFVFLSPGVSPHDFKQYQIREKMKEGFSVIHIENDLSAGLSVADVQREFSDGSQLYVYVLNCLAYHKKLISRLKSPLPENLQIEDSFSKIVSDIDRKLAACKV